MAFIVGFAVIGLGLNVLNTISSMSSADAADALRRQQEAKQAKYNLERQKLAAQIQARADAIFSVWANNYLPVELATLNEIASATIDTARVALVSQRARGEIAKIYAVAKKHKVYALAPQQIGQRLESEIVIATKQADTTAGLVRTMVKQEQARAKLVNAQQLANQMNIINAGRGNTVATTSTLISLAKEYGRLSDEAGKNIDEASRVVGRGLFGAVNGSMEVVKSFKNLNASGALAMPDSIQREPMLSNTLLRDAPRAQPFMVTLQVDSGKEEG